MSTPKTAPMPSQILFEKWSDAGFDWQGELPIASLPRLYGQTDTAFDTDNPVLYIGCTLKKVKGIVWLFFEVKGGLWLTCHRCLSPLDFDVSGAYRMAILPSESKVGELLAYDDTAEYVLLSELGDGKYLPILQLLEDELLLTLPLSATHDDCDMLMDSVGDIPDTPKDNPFAVLQSLKSKT